MVNNDPLSSTHDTDTTPARSTVFSTMALIFGAVVTAAVFCVAGLISLLSDCPDPGDGYETSDLCGSVGGAISFIELAIVAVGMLGPFAGTMLAVRGRSPLWILAGTAVAVAMTTLIFLLANEQTPIIS